MRVGNYRPAIPWKGLQTKYVKDRLTKIVMEASIMAVTVLLIKPEHVAQTWENARKGQRPVRMEAGPAFVKVR